MAASRLGGTCPHCERGRVWLSPDGNPIRLCHKHERLVSDEPGWMEDE